MSLVGNTDCTDIRCHVDIGAIEADGTPAAAQRLADLTGDGAVGGDDLGVLLIYWGHSACIGDLNVDGIVDGLDLSDLLSSWIECK